MNSLRKLRIITYLPPTLPVALFRVYQEYLEETLAVDSYLIVESRWGFPPDGREDPFTGDDVDICFMCSSGYLKMAGQNRYMELLHAAPIHMHEKNQDLRPVYYADVIVPKGRANCYKGFRDLQGHRWAVSGENSLSSSITTQAELRRIGANGSFFGHIRYSGSHFGSIKMVLENNVDAASVNSNALRYWLLDHPEHNNKLHVLCSWGPLPIYPVVVNSRLSSEIKHKITSALLNMDKIPRYKEKLARFMVAGFKEIDESLYEREKEVVELSRGSPLHPAYY